TGVAALVDPARPVLVLVHGAPLRAGPGFRGVRSLVEHLALKGVDVAEWATAVDAEPPPPTRTTDGTLRPTVYMNLCMDVRTPEDAQRMGKLSAALTRLVREGRNVLVSVNTSTLPGAGAPDPMVEFLPALGVTAESGRPLLEESKPRDTPGREVGRDMVMTTAAATHAISGAVDGLRIRLPWAVPLRLKPGEPGLTIEPVLRIPTSSRIWAEAEWNVRSGNPALDSPRDDAGTAGPWVVAAAVERAALTGDQSQRVLVIGSAAWAVDSTLNLDAGVVDGRRVADAPGNYELLSAGVAYLAHRDSAIARSSMARAVPTIPNLTAAQRTTLRAVFVGVVPVAILLLGLAWRGWRG
ncbi:MAG: hypothetical protein ACT4PL_09570, partial [Phycisphaerales bacterium]